jgi:hypothetical protein
MLPGLPLPPEFHPPPAWFEFRIMGDLSPFKVVAFAGSWIALLKVTMWERNAVAFLTRPMRKLWRHLKTGVSGSASFMGLLDEWESSMQWKPGRVMVGTSLYESWQRLGKRDDRHIVTIATIS